MKNKVVLIVLLLLCTVWVYPEADAWGNLKKIYFYDSVGDYGQVRQHLDMTGFEGLKRGDQEELASRLVTFGDYYFDKGRYEDAEAFYNKVLNHSPQYWHLYNKLEKIERNRGSFLISFKNTFKQLVMVLKNFNSSFILVNQFFSMLFFAAMFMFFIYSLLLFMKYFKLAANDLVIDKDGAISFKHMLLLAAMAIWPLAVLSGWMIYPFLICGLLWFYLGDFEKLSLKYILVIVGVITLIYSINLMLENNVRSTEFNKVRDVYRGRLFSKKDYQGFDNRMKVAQAYSYYESGEYNTALDILNATGDAYEHADKDLLLGNIYYRFEELERSIELYKQALLKNENNPAALNNFALALLKEGKPNVFESYSERFPRLRDYRGTASDTKDITLHESELWKRLFNPSGPGFDVFALIKGTLGALFKLPIIYYLLIFGLYIFGLEKLLPTLGESTYCSKCDRIIKEASIHRSYKLCDECHQLFSIKDVIFLEAKILKEKELRKRFKRKYMVYLLFSLLIPGLNFNQRENNRLFFLLALAFYFLAGVAVAGAVNFSGIYAASPLIFNLVGAAAAVLYLLINIISVLGDEDGI